MSRSPKAFPPMRDESGATQEQLTLFSTRDADDFTEISTEKSLLLPEVKGTTKTRMPKEVANYSAADIQILEGIAAIRHRPGMYIGSTSTSGLIHLIWEALDNAVDEAVAGFGKHIWVSIDQDGWVSVRDEGRGLPFDPILYQGDYLPAATVILTVPHSGGKFSDGVYKTAGGLHGVGATVINALSEKLELMVWKDGQHFTQDFSRGTALPYHSEPCDKK